MASRRNAAASNWGNKLWKIRRQLGPRSHRAIVNRLDADGRVHGLRLVSYFEAFPSLRTLYAGCVRGCWLQEWTKLRLGLKKSMTVRSTGTQCMHPRDYTVPPVHESSHDLGPIPR